MALGHPGTALNATAVPYGVLAVPVGTARVYHDEVIVALVRSHPRAAKEEAFQALEDDLETLLKKMDGWATTWRAAKILRERVSLLRVDNTGETRRTRRWAPLEPIGALAGGLFGLATREDAAKLRQAIQNAYDTLQDHATVLQDTVIAVNQLQDYQAQVRDRISALTRAAEKVRTDIASLTSHITHLAVLNVASNMVALLENYHQRAMVFDQDYMHARDQAEVGVLTETLVDQELLTSILKDMRSPLQTDDLYGRTHVKLLSVGNDSVAYTFPIPRMEAEELTAWEIVSTPYQDNGQLTWIIPELSAVAVSASTGDLIATRDCRGRGTKWCRSPIRMRPPPCVQGILGRTPDLIGKCLVEHTDVRLPYVIRVSHHQLLLATEKTRIEERCTPGMTSRILEAGQYLLTPGTGCTIAGPPGWTFHAGTAAHLDIHLLDAYVLPADLNVSISMMSLGGTTPDSPADLAELPEFSGRHIQTPAWGRHPPWFHVTGSYAAWLCSGLAAAMIVTSAAVWWYRRRRSGRRPMTPTNDAETRLDAHTTTPPPSTKPEKDDSSRPLFSRWPRAYPSLDAVQDDADARTEKTDSKKDCVLMPVS